MMQLRAAFRRTALTILLGSTLLDTQPCAFADSGGYRRTTISEPSGAASSAPVWGQPSSGGYRRPSTSGSGYISNSAGDVAISRSTAAQALQQYRAAQQPRRPSVEAGARPDTVWGSGGYGSRRPPSYAALSGNSGGSGGFGSAAFWAMLGALSASDRAAYFQQSQVDPAYQQWRQRVMNDPDAAARLAALGGTTTTATGNVGTTDTASSGGSGIVWLVIFIAGAAFVLLWLARRRAAHQPPASNVPGLSGSAATRFRVGQTIPLDPAAFLLARGLSKVHPPPGSGMISVEAIGLLDDSGVQLHRLYLPGGVGFFQLHLGNDGLPDECRYFSRLDEVHPADPAEWNEWLDPGQGMIGWPSFQTKDGQTYDRAWAPGQSRVVPRQLTETLQTLKVVTLRRLQAMLYARPTGAAPPAPPSEYVMVGAVEDAGQAWVEILAGIDVNPAALKLPAVSL